MVTFRLYGLISLLLLTAVVWASPLTSRRLSDDRFRDPDWIVLQDENSDTQITQLWREPLRNLPKGVDGYLMVSYQVQQANSPQEAIQHARTLLKKERFNQYHNQGYEVEMIPWDVAGQRTVQYLVHGLNHTSAVTTAHRAEIYIFAMAQEKWVIWLEVHLVSTANDLDVSERSLQKASGSTVAGGFVKEVLALWMPTPESLHPAEGGAVTPPIPTMPPTANPPITPAAPVMPSTPATPPAAVTTPRTPATPATPVTPTTPPAAVTVPSTPATPVTPATPPAAVTVPSTPATQATPVTPAAPPAAVTAPSTPAAPATPATPVTPATPPAAVTTPSTPATPATPVTPATPPAAVTTPSTPAPPATPVTPAAPPAAVTAPSTPAAPATPATPVTPATPPAAVTTPSTPAAPAAPATPVTPATPPAAVTAPSTPATPATPVTPATPPAAVTTPSIPAAPPASPTLAPEPAGRRWQTEDGLLTLFLPDGWKVSGKSPHPYDFTGLPNATVRLFPSERYANDTELKKALDDFVASQQEISAGHFAQQDYHGDGATGVWVKYTNFVKHTVLSYYFGKSSYLWRFEVELDRENAPAPELVTELMAHIRMTP